MVAFEGHQEVVDFVGRLEEEVMMISFLLSAKLLLISTLIRSSVIYRFPGRGGFGDKNGFGMGSFGDRRSGGGGRGFRGGSGGDGRGALVFLP